MAAIEPQLVPEAALGQVQRVRRRFALVAVAGELASETGITGWPKGEAIDAARAVFNAWLMVRPGSTCSASPPGAHKCRVIRIRSSILGDDLDSDA